MKMLRALFCGMVPAAALMGGTSAVFAQATYPAPAPIARPADNPALPPQMDRFVPPVAVQTAAASAPQFGEWSRSISPSETLTAFGSAFASGAAGGFVLFGQTTATDARTAAASAAQLDDNARALITVPALLPANSAYLLWARNAAGYSLPVLLNTAEAWWVGPDIASAGSTISVYGRNLTYFTRPDEKTKPPKAEGNPRPVFRAPLAWVYIKPSGGAGSWAAVTAANPYKVDIKLPATLAPGTYELWAHNGHGGNYGWAKPLTLTIQAPTTWSNTVFNVRDFGATPNDGTDDEAAIEAAFSAAWSQPYSTIYFPAGTYHAGRGFVMPPNTRIRGDGMNLSHLVVHPNFTTPAEYDGRRYCLFFGGGDNTVVSDITLDANSSQRGYLQTLIYQRSSTNLRYERIRILAQDMEAFDLHGSRSVTLQDCEIAAAGSFLGAISQLFIDRCAFRGTFDANQLLAFFGSDYEISITRCTAADWDNSDPSRPDGWAQGRFVVFQSHWGSAGDIYFGDNQTINLGVRPLCWNQNTGEQFLLETGTCDYKAVTAVNGATLSVSNAAGWDNSNSVLIVGGKGTGQVRRVVGRDAAAGTLTLDAPLGVTPDATSDIRIGRLADRIAIYRNRFDGKPVHVIQSDHVATVAVYWQATTRLIIDSNQLTNMRAAFSAWGTMPGEQGTPDVKTMPVAWADVVNNTGRFSRYGLGTQIADWGVAGTQRGSMVLAQTYRCNTLTDVLDNGIGITRYWQTPEIPVANIVYEFNTVFAPNPFWAGLRPDGTYLPGEVYLRGNQFIYPAVQSFFAGTTPALPDAADGVPYELGFQFETTVSGKLAAIRHWKSPSETGAHTGKLWAANGTLLAAVTFTNETAQGWQQANFAQPVTLQPNTRYVVTVNCNVHYPITTDVFRYNVTYANLFAPGSGVNGLYGAVGAKPTQTYANSSYLRDIVFLPTP